MATRNAKQTSLTEEQLNTVLEFSQGLYSNFNGFGLNNPYSQYQNLLKINNNPSKVTYEKLVKALESAPYNYDELASYSEFMSVWDSIYSNTINYLAGLLSFDLSYTCTNIKNPSEYSSKAYEEDVQRVNKFLNSFDYKQEFRKIVKECLKKEVSYVYFRDTQDISDIIDLEDNIKKKRKFGIQIMPDKFCRLTGYFDCSNLLYDFDLSYFLNSGVDINLFAPELKKKFKEAYRDNNNNYVPSAQLDHRNGFYSNWVQTSPLGGAWAFKLQNETFSLVPILAPLMKACIGNDEAISLQRDKNMLQAYLILAGEIPLLNTDKSGNKANAFAISPSVMGEFMQLVSQGLKDNVKPAALPLKNLVGLQFDDKNPESVENQMKTSAAQGGAASTMIYSTEKSSQFELENQIYTDYALVKPMYSQFASFLNFMINRKTKKYKFSFVFDGLDRQWDRERRVEYLRNYADKGIVLDATQWASAIGMRPQDFMASLECAHNSKFLDNLSFMFNANTMKSGFGDGSDEGGAPTKSVTERSDKTEGVYDSQ